MAERGNMPRAASAMRRPAFGLVLAAVAALAAGVKLWLAATTYGTNDVYAYERFATWSRDLGVGLYAAAGDFNHPPSMMPVLQGLDALARATGVSFAFWLRLLPTLADAGGLFVVYRLLQPARDELRVRKGLLLLAASPVLVLVSGFHGNTDSIVMLFLLGSVYWTDRVRRDVLAGVAFGLAMSVKIVPIVALPALLLWRPRARDRALFALGAAATLAACWLPWLLPDARRALAQIFGYRSLHGGWGLSWLLALLVPGTPVANGFRTLGAPLLLLAIGAATFVMSRRRPPTTVYAALTVVFGMMLSLGNAFGVQYLAWLAPWIVGLPLQVAAFFALAAGGFLFVVYNYWAGGWPWYLADSNVVGSYVGHLDVFHLIAWLSVLAVSWCAVARVRSADGRPVASRAPEPALPPSQPVQPAPAHAVLPAPPALVSRGAALACGAGLLALCAFQARKDSGGPSPAAQRASLAAVRAGQHVKLSSLLLRAGRSDEGIAAALRALEIVPTQPVAWNNLAAGHANKGEWDAAIDAAERALAIEPTFALARNNLRWAQSQKQAFLTTRGP